MSISNAPPLRKYYYVARKQTYEDVGDGTVRVTDENGRAGLFRWNGPYVEGDITQCNLHMLIWTGGPSLPPELNYRWTEVPASITRPSGWPEELEKLLPHQLGKA
jgi:hypothetical protein